MQRIVREQVVPIQGGSLDSADHLYHDSVSGDRAYQNRELAFKAFLPAVLSCLEQSSALPFSFETKLAETDKREDVPLTGAKTLFIKEASHAARSLYAFAYPNNGGVKLADGDLDRSVLYEMRFKPIGGDSSSIDPLLLHVLPTKPIQP